MDLIQEKKITSSMPVHCVWGILCSLSSIDQEKNNISLFNVIEQVNFPQEAFDKKKESKNPLLVNFPHELVLLWKRVVDIPKMNNELIFDFKVKLRDPKGGILQESLFSTKIHEKSRRMRFRVNLPGIFITTPGDYTYDIEVKKISNGEFQMIKELQFEIQTLPRQPLIP